jgi:uncharacterized membrane protein
MDIWGNSLDSPYELEFKTEISSEIDEPDLNPTNVYEEDFTIYYIAAIVDIILILIILAFIYRRKRNIREEHERTVVSGFGVEVEDEMNGTDELIKELTAEAMAPEKPSQFSIDSEDMLDDFKEMYRKGEISKETYSLIQESLSKRNG